MTFPETLELIQTIAIVVGGFWVIYNFIWKREQFPKVSFALDLKLLDVKDGKLILEFIALLENKGLVRHYIDLETFILKIRYIKDADPLVNIAELSFKNDKGEKEKFDFFCLNFPHSFKSEINKGDILWLPKEWEYIFVDGGVTQKINLPLVLPGDAKYVLVKSEFKYRNDKRSGLHTAQEIFKVDELKKQN